MIAMTIYRAVGRGDNEQKDDDNEMMQKQFLGIGLILLAAFFVSGSAVLNRTL